MRNLKMYGYITIFWAFLGYCFSEFFLSSFASPLDRSDGLFLLLNIYNSDSKHTIFQRDSSRNHENFDSILQFTPLISHTNRWQTQIYQRIFLPFLNSLCRGTCGRSIQWRKLHPIVRWWTIFERVGWWIVDRGEAKFSSVFMWTNWRQRN